MTDDETLRHFLHESIGTMLALNQAVSRRAAGMKHPPIPPLIEAAKMAYERMMAVTREHKGDAGAEYMLRSLIRKLVSDGRFDQYSWPQLSAWWNEHKAMDAKREGDTP